MAVDVRSSLELRSVRESLGLSRERIARAFDVSAKSIERWEESGGPSRPEQRARLAELAEIAELGRVVYPGDGFRLFLNTPLPAFGGRTALQAVEIGRAADVLGALAGDYEGGGS